MGVRLQAFPEHGVSLQVVDGTVTPDELFKHFCALRERAAAGWRPPARWITYIAPTADPSLLDVSSLPDLRRAAAAAISEVYADEPFTEVFVCAPGSNWRFIDTWRRYLEAGGERAATVHLPNLQAACDRLNLSDSAHKALAEAIGAERFEGREANAAPSSERPTRA
jgi:hypothetical protein